VTRKKVVTKGVVSYVPIHLVRPSKKIEVLFTAEAEALRAFEGPWDNLKSLSDKYEKGVPVGEVASASELYSTNYNAQMAFTKSLNSWAAARRRCMTYAAILFEGKKKAEWKNAMKRPMLEALAEEFIKTPETEVANHFDRLSPYHLLECLRKPGELLPKWIEYTRSYKMKNLGGLGIKASKDLSEEGVSELEKWYTEISDIIADEAFNNSNPARSGKPHTTGRDKSKGQGRESVPTPYEYYSKRDDHSVELA
jgi:hypothetical protein